MRYLKLFILFIKSNLQMELEYRANFLVQVVMGLFWTMVTVFSAFIVFNRADKVGGWTFDQALVLIGIYEMFSGLIEAVFQPNVRKIVTMVREGTMDFVFTKPVNSQFISSVRYSRLSALGPFFAGIAIVWVGLQRLNHSPTPVAWAQFAFMVFMALVIIYSIWIMIATISFWAVKVDELGELFVSLWETGRYPISTFQGAVRIALTFVLPVAFMTTFPAEAMLGSVSLINLGLSLLMAIAFTFISTTLWHKAVSNYSSASS